MYIKIYIKLYANKCIYVYTYINMHNFLQYFALRGAESLHLVVFTHLFALLISINPAKTGLLDLIPFLSHAIRIHALFCGGFINTRFLTGDCYLPQSTSRE